MGRDENPFSISVLDKRVSRKNNSLVKVVEKKRIDVQDDKLEVTKIVDYNSSSELLVVLRLC